MTHADDIVRILRDLELDDSGAVDLGPSNEDADGPTESQAEPDEGSESQDPGPEGDGTGEASTAEAESDAEEPASPEHRAGFYLTPRQTFTTLAGVLAVLLIALLVYLYWLSRPADFTKRGGDEQAKIIPVLAIYGPGKGATPTFNTPMGAAWSPDAKRIYVADTKNDRVCAFDADGKFLFQVGGHGIAKPLAGAPRTWKPGLLNYPTDVATDEAGNVYVADFYNDSISVFDPAGKFLRRFPDPDKPVGKGSSGQDGRGIAVTALTVADGKVYATDAYQIVVFTTQGKFVEQFGMPGLGPTGMDRPGGVAVDSAGRVYVSDSNHNRVIAFDRERKPLWVTGRRITDLNKETKNPFILPRGMSLMRDGSILVADPLAQDIVKLGQDGKVIATYGVRGTAEGQLNFPNDVNVRRDRIVVADRANQRVQVIRLAGR